MKAFIRIFVDEYETSVDHLKDTEITAITTCLYEYIATENVSFEVNLKRYLDPLAINIPQDFMKKIDKHRFELRPYGFHKNLKIQMDYVAHNNFICSCSDIWCNGTCGTLICGCIDVCRDRCANHKSYY